MYTEINTLKADSVEKLLYLAYKISIYLSRFPHLSLEICSWQEQHKIISLCVKIGTITSYVDNFSKTLNNYVIASNIFDCNISYINILSKLIACYSPSRFASTHKIEHI